MLHALEHGRQRFMADRRRRQTKDAADSTHDAGSSPLTARGKSLAAFDGRCIPAGCVAPRSNTPGIAPHRAQDARWGPRSAVVAPLRRGPHGADCAPWGGTSGRLAALGATLDFHHGLLTPLAAHHVISAKFDSAKQVTLRGPI